MLQLLGVVTLETKTKYINNEGISDIRVLLT